jgi:hypothetical protein
MLGYGNPVDSVPIDNVFMWGDEKGFYPIKASAVSPQRTFLREMSKRYPDQNFAGLCSAYPSAWVSQWKPGFPNRDMFYSRLSRAKQFCTFGGIVSMYGINDGEDRVRADAFYADFMAIINEIRDSVDNPNLPCIFGRNETFQPYIGGMLHYTIYAAIVEYQGQRICKEPNVYQCPIRPIPKELYADDHHYNRLGHEIFGCDVVALFQINNLDWWNK